MSKSFRERTTMPCYDGRDYESKQRERLELDRVTALLCDTCRYLEKEKLIEKLPMKLTAWWREHQEADSKRAWLETRIL